MAFKTTPILNRIKHIKGWKNSSFPNKKNMYTRDIVLYLKIYLLMNAYLNLNGFKLVRCHLSFIESNNKLLQLLIMRDRKWKTSKKKKFTADASQLFFPKQRKAISLLYKIINKKKNSNYLTKNLIKKIRIKQNWVAKPRTFDWTPFFIQNRRARQNNFIYKHKLLILHKNLRSKWIKNNYENILQRTFKINLLLKSYSPLFRKIFRNQKQNYKSPKKIIYIYNHLKKYLQQKYVAMLATKHNYKKQKKITKQYFFKQKKTQVDTLNYYSTIKKNMRKQRNKNFWTELQTLFINMARLQFKNKVQSKEKSLKSFLYSKTQFYKTRTKISFKYYYFFQNVYHIWLQLRKRTSTVEGPVNTKIKTLNFNNLLLRKTFATTNRSLIKCAKKNPPNNFVLRKKSIITAFSVKDKTLIQTSYIYRQKILLVKLLNSAFENKKKIYKFKLIKKTIFPRLIKLFKSVRFKKKTEAVQTKQKIIKVKNRELILLKNNVDKQLKPYKNVMNLKNQTNNILPKRKSTHENKNKQARLNYRIPYRTNYKEFVTFTTKQYLKHIISKFLQSYFRLKFNIKLTNLSNSLQDKKYHYVCFPVKKDKNRKSNPKISARKKMKMINSDEKQNKNKHKIRYLCIHENTLKFLVKNTKTEKQTLKALIKNIKLQIRQSSNKKLHTQKKLWLKKIYILKQKLKIISRKKYPNFTRKIVFKKNKMLVPVIPFTKDLSNLNRFNRVKSNMNIVYLFAKYMEPQLLANYIVKILEITKKHWQAITQINQLLKNIHSNKNLVYRIGIFGRFNSTEKAKKVYFTLGNMRSQTFNKKINFASAQSRPLIGTIGVKIWTYW